MNKKIYDKLDRNERLEIVMDKLQMIIDLLKDKPSPDKLLSNLKDKVDELTLEYDQIFTEYSLLN